MPELSEIRAAILEAVRERGPAATVCPSEIARALAGDWRALMELVRAEARALQRDGLIEWRQGGVPVDPDVARGPVRLAARPEDRSGG